MTCPVNQLSSKWHVSNVKLAVSFWGSHWPLPRRNVQSHAAKTLQGAADRMGEPWFRLMPSVLWPWAETRGPNQPQNGESCSLLLCHGDEAVECILSSEKTSQPEMVLLWVPLSCPQAIHLSKGLGRSTENKTGCSLQSSVTAQGPSVRSQPCPPGTLSLPLLSSSPRCITSGQLYLLGASHPFATQSHLALKDSPSFKTRSSISLVLCLISDSLKTHIPPFPLSLIF